MQTCISCLEGLVPEPRNTAILQLLYVLALWHGLAKLHQHIDPTLELLEAFTKRLGDELRRFETYSTARFKSVETPKEKEAWDRREDPKNAPLTATRRPSKAPAKRVSGHHQKRFSLSTVQIHLLGHYVPTIRRFGSTNSYSTQVVSSHPVVLANTY